MASDAIDRWPAGERPTFFATPGAWEILQIVEREALSLGARLQLLAPYTTRDLRGAYFLTRDLAALQRRQVLADGEDAGRAARIRARNLLKRAFAGAHLKESASQAAGDLDEVRAQLRASPPVRAGYLVKSVRQVLALAASGHPLSIRMRRLLAVRQEDLRRAAAHIEALAPGRFLYPSWPTPEEREHLLQVLALASALLEERT
jgi:hypothetical protein